MPELKKRLHAIYELISCNITVKIMLHDLNIEITFIQYDNVKYVTIEKYDIVLSKRQFNSFSELVDVIAALETLLGS